MNIEIANRLVNLRKRNSLSQEALALKLGISRQAVSKWERAEASPDTDNLIMLARLYGISLDELLMTEDDIYVQRLKTENTQSESIQIENQRESMRTESPQTENMQTESQQTDKQKNERAQQEASGTGSQDENIIIGKQEESTDNQYKADNQEYVHIGTESVHVKDKDGSEVYIGWDGIHINENEGGENINIDGNGVYINGRKYEGDWIRYWKSFPFALIIVLIYFVTGVFFNAWHPAWLLFILIPLWESFIRAVKKRNANIFAYPVLAALIYLCGGFFIGTWHPGWIIFLTVPIYYAVVNYIDSLN